MPVDIKRITAPDSSIPYRLYSSNNVKSYSELLSEVVDKKKLRKGGRKMNDARQIYADLGTVPQAKGSAYVEMGNTKVIVTVYEPRELPKQTTFGGQGELFCDVKFAPFSHVKRIPLQPGAEEREMAAAMRRALEPAVLRHLFPNFQIDIFAYVLENDGGLLATVINAAGLALADAEVPMYDCIVALTIGIQDELTFIDPTADEEQLCLMNNVKEDGDLSHGIIVKVLLPEIEQISELWQHGAISLDKVLNIIESHKPEYEELYTQIRATLSEKCKKFLDKKHKKDKKALKKDIDVGKLIESIQDNINIS